jgi:hypothetical protein
VIAVLIALPDVGPGVQLEEQLNAQGFSTRWDASCADGPRTAGASLTQVVLIDADHLGKRLSEVAEMWRDAPSVPGVVAMGSSAIAREQAPAARVTLVTPGAKLSTIANAINEAAKLRLATGMRWNVLRAATGLPPITETQDAWQLTLTASRRVDIEIPRSALRWHAPHYATGTAKLETMREERMLQPGELESVGKLDGTLTVQTLVGLGKPLDPQSMARYLWTMASMGAVELTPEIRDRNTPARALLDDLRRHLRARSQRLEKSTFYDVLEITPLAEYPDIEEAYRLVSWRYAPANLLQHDLSELKPLVQPMWELVEKARSVLVDHAQRGRYHDWLRQRMSELRTVWAIDPGAVQTAQALYARGQTSLGEGDVHKAMGELAAACRHFPGHPEYEANLAWARYRVQVASGRDRVEAAIAERKAVEQCMAGCRPWPRALVALALLCAASGDADSARWHLHVALQVDPKVPAAAQLAQRLGMRRY